MPNPACSHTSLPHGSVRRFTAALGAALVVFAVTGVGSAFAAPPNRVLSDKVLRNSNSMSAAEIQAYLNTQPGPLKTLVTSDYDKVITPNPRTINVNLTPDTDGVKKPASLIIWEACRQWKVNPRVMLTMLQKEQRLLTRTSLTSTTLSRALGAGCSSGTTNKYPGFGNQIWYGARLLDGYGEGKNGSRIALYYPGIRVWDVCKRPKVAVYPYHRATYKLYVYNPSIGGNTTFWNIYSSRFGNSIWPAVTRATSTRLYGSSSVKVRRTLKLTGKVSSAAAPGRVTISMTRLVGGTWKSEGSARADVVKGSYRYSFRPTKRGTWRFIARYSGGETVSASYQASKSVARNVRVR